MKPPTPFDVYRSLWAPRTSWAESQDLYDTEEVRLTRFSADWTNALSLGLVRVILRGDGDEEADEDGDGIPDEVEEVGEAIWAHNQLVTSLFSNYASLNGSLNSLSLASWGALVTDCQLTTVSSRFNKLSDFERIFSETYEMDTSSAALGAGGHLVAEGGGGGGDGGDALSRPEFLIVLVRISISMFVLTHEIPDVSDAVSQLLGVCVQSRLGALVTADPDAFRRLYCYCEPTCKVLKRNEGALQRIFACIVLPFEGFMEALIRIGALKAFPTAGEMLRMPEGSAERTDAGAYLAQLQQLHTARHAKLVEERAGTWCGAVPVYGFERRVQCTIDIFQHAVQAIDGAGA
ncbi:hypothetical protein Ctob_000723 [Chrysochromulina tobinii]|uniref:Uncharacterized protein n=1 Tax=Chrysochromulina tobinii TaxID=1460289 RepID=A0A0M0J6M4_9EUKA|nr:hypothetical protein Ctob_000723 [Chrysochromulina tobinii]|eukprot:KOO21957.1 hypothetical protein Ctob_000723 [Chrysochromulina sp. CCMP291]